MRPEKKTHQFSDLVEHQVNELFADGVMLTNVVDGSVLLMNA